MYIIKNTLTEHPQNYINMGLFMKFFRDVISIL